jgi:hypothetical protein
MGGLGGSGAHEDRRNTVQDLGIKAVAMAIAISLLVWLYNLSPGDQPWVVFGAMAGLALSKCGGTGSHAGEVRK